MAECILIRAGGGGVRPDELSAEDVDVLDGRTFIGRNGIPQEGHMNDFTDQTINICGYENSGVQVHPEDPNQAVVKGLVNRSESGYIARGSTAIEFNIANAVPKNIKYGVKIGRTEYGDWGADSSNTITGEFTGDANALEDYMLEGQIAYSKGKKLYGKMKNRNIVDPSIGGINKDWPTVGIHKASNPQISQTTVSNERLLSFMCPIGFYDGGYVGVEMTTIAAMMNAKPELILKGHTICDVAGTLAVNSAFSFSIAAISSTEIEIYWTNPSKGPYSGVFIEMSTSGYPTAGNSTRVYTGMGTNRNPGGRSSCKITGLQPQTTYYFTANSYCEGLPNGINVNLTATTGKASGQQTFTTSGTFTVPEHVTAIKIWAVGGGAGGSDRYNTSSERAIIGGGGAGGTKLLDSLSVTPGQQLTITIGTGGARNKPGSSTTIYRGSERLLIASAGRASYQTEYDPTGADGGSGGGAGGGDANGSDTTGSGYAGNGGANGARGGNGLLVMESDSEEFTRTYEGGAGQESSTRTPSGTASAGGGAGGLLRYYSSSNIPAKGGDGIGGNGAVISAYGDIAATNGASGTGSGGGGGISDAIRAGIGASGMVIISWGGL